ncbi:coproporphyrinogen III oxidase-like Fe-S oxidoreductase [Myroides gitamensis]|nr:coproporphyrinogen III oxidase-like Fe-S oxidoreductase [Myroides gitamensis]
MYQKMKKKEKLYEIGKNLLEEKGYIEIGMDHFALKTDSLYKAMNTNSIHRNFMGYTSSKTDLMIGLGVSSISDSWTAFAQNEKNIGAYYEALANNEIPVVKGHILNEEDLIIRKHILHLMCNLQTDLTSDLHLIDFTPMLEELKEMENDQLITIQNNVITINKLGRAFVRNICMALDLRLQRNKPERALFSMTI